MGQEQSQLSQLSAMPSRASQLFNDDFDQNIASLESCIDLDQIDLPTTISDDEGLGLSFPDSPLNGLFGTKATVQSPFSNALVESDKPDASTESWSSRCFPLSVPFKISTGGINGSAEPADSAVVSQQSSVSESLAADNSENVIAAAAEEDDVLPIDFLQKDVGGRASVRSSLRSLRSSFRSDRPPSSVSVYELDDASSRFGVRGSTHLNDFSASDSSESPPDLFTDMPTFGRSASLLRARRRQAEAQKRLPVSARPSTSSSSSGSSGHNHLLEGMIKGVDSYNLVSTRIVEATPTELDYPEVQPQIANIPCVELDQILLDGLPPVEASISPVTETAAPLPSTSDGKSNLLFLGGRTTQAVVQPDAQLLEHQTPLASTNKKAFEFEVVKMLMKCFLYNEADDQHTSASDTSVTASPPLVTLAAVPSQLEATSSTKDTFSSLLGRFFSPQKPPDTVASDTANTSLPAQQHPLQSNTLKRCLSFSPLSDDGSDDSVPPQKALHFQPAVSFPLQMPYAPQPVNGMQTPSPPFCVLSSNMAPASSVTSTQSVVSVPVADGGELLDAKLAQPLQAETSAVPYSTSPTVPVPTSPQHLTTHNGCTMFKPYFFCQHIPNCVQLISLSFCSESASVLSASSVEADDNGRASAKALLVPTFQLLCSLYSGPQVQVQLRWLFQAKYALSCFFSPNNVELSQRLSAIHSLLQSLIEYRIIDLTLEQNHGTGIAYTAWHDWTVSRTVAHDFFDVCDHVAGGAPMLRGDSQTGAMYCIWALHHVNQSFTDNMSCLSQIHARLLC